MVGRHCDGDSFLTPCSRLSSITASAPIFVNQFAQIILVLAVSESLFS